jgi:uncharacterized protein YggE
MKKFIFPVILMILSGFTFAQSGEKNFIDQPYIEVTGTADIEIVPDMIYLKITINETDTKGKISLEALEKKMKQSLGELGIDIAKDLTVEDLSSNYIKYFLKEKDIVTSREYVLLVHDAAMAGKSINALSDENISNISILKVDHSLMAQKRFDLRLEAVKTSKIKAEAMAEAIGQKIGKAIFLSEYTDIAPLLQSNVSGVLYMKNREENYTEPELSFKNIQLKSSVTARYILN